MILIGLFSIGFTGFGGGGGAGDIQLIYLFNEDFEDGAVSDWTDGGDHTVEVTSSTGANGTSYSLSISGSGATGIYH